MSSCLNASAAVCWEDIFKPLIGSKVSESTKTWITRILVAVFGGAGIGFAFMARNLGGTVLQASLSFTGAASGPLLGIFLLGGLFPFANSAGCVSGGLLGLVFSMWISFGSYSLPRKGYALDFPTDECSIALLNTTISSAATNTTSPGSSSQISGIQHLYTVSYLWFCSIGAAAAVIIGLLVSFITMPLYKKREVDPKYLIPLVDRLFCYLPDKWRKVFRCGYEFKDPEELVEEQEMKEEEIKVGKILFSNPASGDKMDKDPVLILHRSRDLGHRNTKEAELTDTAFENVAFDKDSEVSVKGQVKQGDGKIEKNNA